MNGAHDMGGAQGFGPVTAIADDEHFHAPWERRAFGLTLAVGATGAWNLDMSRRARENRPPGDYLAKSYFELWVAGLDVLLPETGLASAREIATGVVETPPVPVKRVVSGAMVPEVLARGAPTHRQVGFPPRFRVGEAVVAKEINPPTHTRLPRYVRGKPGEIVAWRGAHIFPDAHAHGHGEAPHHLYTVRFDARVLWGPDTTADEVLVDCWEPYLDPRAEAQS